MDSWSAVPGLHEDLSREPFLAVAVGGHEVANSGDAADELQVWTVTLLGRVFARQGVTATCPEGTGWLRIPTPDRYEEGQCESEGSRRPCCSCEVGQISVAPSGLVWAVTLSGQALIRLGVSRLEPRGTHWTVLAAPSPLSHVSVGQNAVWALSRERSVWFRQGVRAAAAGQNESLAKGNKWVQMVGEMLMLSVGPADQVRFPYPVQSCTSSFRFSAWQRRIERPSSGRAWPRETSRAKPGGR